MNFHFKQGHKLFCRNWQPDISPEAGKGRLGVPAGPAGEAAPPPDGQQGRGRRQPAEAAAPGHPVHGPVQQEGGPVAAQPAAAAAAGGLLQLQQVQAAPHGKVHPRHLPQVRRGAVPVVRPGADGQVPHGHVFQAAGLLSLLGLRHAVGLMSLASMYLKCKSISTQF